jgi:hypothetical protein
MHPYATTGAGRAYHQAADTLEAHLDSHPDATADIILVATVFKRLAHTLMLERVRDPGVCAGIRDDAQELLKRAGHVSGRPGNMAFDLLTGLPAEVSAALLASAL